MVITETARRKVVSLLKDTNECIEYPILNVEGYGLIQSNIGNKKLHMLAHRVSYQISTGINLVPTDIICHRCDNPACINPKHLFKGTHKDNMKDKVLKNRQAKGANNGRYIDGRASDNIVHKIHTHGRKLSEEEVIKIKSLIDNNIKLIDISRQLNISYQTIRDIHCNRAYANI